MREIKFRAWDKGNEKYLASVGMLSLFGLTEKEILVQMPASGIRALPRDRVEVTQYTGLKDKNGKEIYEGDVVTGFTSFEMDNDAREWTIEKPAIISWDERGCAFYPFSLNARWRCDVKNIEVIGNIYENPELLKCPT